MDRPRANTRREIVALRVVLILGLAGCSNQQMSASNPFMAPDRVPPPATRTIAPGTAAPYYPGDPVPSAQVPPAPPITPIAAQGQPPVTQLPITPVGSAPQPLGPQPLAFSNERSVAIPADDADLRFSAQQPAQPPITPPQPQAPMQQAAAPQATTPQAPMPQVVPAAYNQPLASQPAPAESLVPAAAAADTGGPWRSPQISNGPVSNGTTPVMQAQYVQPQQYQPNPWQVQPPPQPTPPVSTVPVQLQPVPSPTNVPTVAPSPQVAPPMFPATTNPPPRMRFPSWTDPTTWFTPQPDAAGPQPGQQLIGYMVPGPNGQMQMVSVEQMQAMSGGAAQGTTNVASSDGFRPRGTATK